MTGDDGEFGPLLALPSKETEIKIKELNAKLSIINQKISATAPLSEMFGYATSLRSVTQGRRVYTMEFFMYSECPKQIFDELVSSKS